MKAENSTSLHRLNALLKSKAIFVSSLESQETSKYNTETYEPAEINESCLVGKVVGGVVVGKNESTKELRLHLTDFYDQNKKVHINSHRFIAFIKDYELVRILSTQKANASIFGYLNSFKDLEVGTFINAWVRRTERRQNNKVIIVFPKTYFELHLNRQADNKGMSMKLGVINDSVKIPQSVLRVYQKEQTLPLNFLILYEASYDNPGLGRIFEKDLRIRAIGSLHQMSNLAGLQKLGYNYHRIRHIQQRSWRDEHLELGLQCMKDSKYESAIQCFNVSLKFDPDFVDTHIAKACSYVNMNNVGEGVKSIKEALKIDPLNQRARKYYEQFQKQLLYKGEEEGTGKKKAPEPAYKMVFQK